MENQQADRDLEPALRDVESIQNLDTARLALRWALERMRTLERRIEEVQRDGKAAGDARARAEAELEGSRDLLSRRTSEALERERYYAKVEEYLNLKLAGGLDAAALAKREARLEERERELQSREIETETRIKEAKRRFNEDVQLARSDAAARADAKVKEVREEFERRTVARDRELSERLISLHEKDAQLTALEKSLEERRKRFEEFHAAQRTALEREASAISQAAADQAEFLERRIEQAMAAKTTALQRAWQTDQQSLMDEIAAWREKAREHLPALLEAQRRASSVEEERDRLAQENAVLVEVRRDLDAELSRWRAKAQQDVAAVVAAERRASAAEDEIQRLKNALSVAQRAIEESRAELMAHDASLDLRRRELERLEDALAQKLRDSELHLFRQYDSWIEREAALRRRDQDWRFEAAARHESLDVLRAEVAAQRDELKRAIDAYREKTKTLSEEERRKGEAL